MHETAALTIISRSYYFVIFISARRSLDGTATLLGLPWTLHAAAAADTKHAPTHHARTHAYIQDHTRFRPHRTHADQLKTGKQGVYKLLSSEGDGCK